MKILYHTYTREQYSDHEFLVDREIDFLMEMAAFMAGRDLQQGDEKRMTRQYLPEPKGYFVVYWDGIRKGVMYSGFNDDSNDPNKVPVKWLMYFIPDEQVNIAS